MADDKKNIPETAPPAEAPAPTVENVAVPEPPAPDLVLTDAEAVMLEQEGHAALFEMGDAVPDPADTVTLAEVEEPAAPEAPKAEKEQAQPPDPGKDAPAPAHSGKVVDFAAAREEAAKEEKKAIKQKPPTEKNKAAKPGRGRPPKDGKAAPDKAKPPKPRDKKSQSKPAPEKPAVDKGGAPAGAEVTPEPSAPRDATRPVKEEIVYLNLSDLHPFKNHPFGVRDDAEMQGLVESVKAAGVNQPALVHPREDGGYPLSQTPMFQCLLLEDGQEPEWCEGERLTSAGGSWTPSIGQAPGWHDGSASFLWQTLEDGVPTKYFLSPAQCSHFLHLAEIAGCPPPAEIEALLLKQGGAYQLPDPFNASVCGPPPRSGRKQRSETASDCQLTLFPLC